MMIPDFRYFCLNEWSLKSVKKTIHGVLDRSNRAQLKKIMKNNVVYFKFAKKDGTLRDATGTLNHRYLPALKGGSPKPEHQFVYYDLEKGSWRSFRSFSFIKIINIKSISEYEHKTDKEEIEKKKKHELHKKKLEHEKEKHLHKPDDEPDKEKEIKHHHPDIKKKEKSKDEDDEPDDEEDDKKKGDED